MQRQYRSVTTFDEQDDGGSELIYKVLRHYEEISVDIVSLDRDQQDFFGVLGDIRKIQTDFFDYVEVVFEQYTRVHHLSEEIYRRAERIQEHVNKNFPSP